MHAAIRHDKPKDHFRAQGSEFSWGLGAFRPQSLGLPSAEKPPITQSLEQKPLTMHEPQYLLVVCHIVVRKSISGLYGHVVAQSFREGG